MIGDRQSGVQSLLPISVAAARTPAALAGGLMLLLRLAAAAAGQGCISILPAAAAAGLGCAGIARGIQCCCWYWL